MSRRKKEKVLILRIRKGDSIITASHHNRKE
jgi:hypothetical protein